MFIDHSTRDKQDTIPEQLPMVSSDIQLIDFGIAYVGDDSKDIVPALPSR